MNLNIWDLLEIITFGAVSGVLIWASCNSGKDTGNSGIHKVKLSEIRRLGL